MIRDNINMCYRCVHGGGGCALGARTPPPPHLGKKFRSKMSKRGEKVLPRYVGKKECARSAQIGKKEENSKRKIKNDSHLSELYSRFFSRLFTIYCCFEHKQVILAFIFVFIVYRIVSYIFERLFKPSGTGPNVLKS